MVTHISIKASTQFASSDSFQRLTDGLPSELSGIFNLSQDEACVGLYRNSNGLNELILITELGIHINQTDSSPIFVPYGGIKKIEWLAKKDKLTTQSDRTKRVLLLTLADNSVVNCPVRGEWRLNPSEPGISEIANFHTFLLGVIRKLPARSMTRSLLHGIKQTWLCRL